MQQSLDKNIKKKMKFKIVNDDVEEPKIIVKPLSDELNKPTETLEDLKKEYEMNDCGSSENKYDKSCNTFLLKKEFLERKELSENPEEDMYLYPNLNDPNFIVKIAEKKEFNDTKYDGKIYNIKEQADILANAEFELAPQQAFVRNFLSFQTPYNSLLLYHGLGSGKTCTAIGVCEEQRDYLKQMGISKRIIVVASPNVQDNFRLQLFDERKLKLVDGLWNIKGCVGNKLLKEINPMNMKGIPKEKVISQIKTIINTYYLFVGYIEFSNYIEKIQEVKGNYKNEKDKNVKMLRNLKYEFDNRLIVIDEIHNIRIAEDNKNKKVAMSLLNLVKSSSNLRLLLLSATPMYNSYKEVIWLLNLMNLNDKRATIEIKDVFDSNGEFKKGKNGEEIGKELLIRKATGYVSFVRGENPYTFPFRVFPFLFSPTNTFNDIPYPTYQMNGKKITEKDKIDILKSNIYLTNIGSYQSIGYQFIIDSLKNKKFAITTKKGIVRDMPSFENMESFGYTLLTIPLESLNIVYPMEGLEDMVNNKTPIESLSPISSISPAKSNSSLENSSISPVLEKVNNIPSLEQRIELTEKPSSERSITSYNSNNIRGGQVSSDESVESVLTNSRYINPNDLTGKNGLERVMTFIDSKNPPEKGSFEYKKWILDKDERIFSKGKIGKYSSKIKSICNSIVNENGVVSEGVILIYSQYIDAGIIPIALALEEMGFSRYAENAKSMFKTPPTELVDSRTMKPRQSKTETFMPAKYVMITGDHRISPNNDFEVKSVTNDSNKYGDKIKVILISQAGSEGIDFKFIRQIHILEPWYNMNLIEQIIGRGVRNFSHKDLDFEKRNVQIFMYGTILENNTEEAADVYVYRVAEYKALQIGKVSRVLKETSVDCIINHDQTNFTQENIEKNTTENIKQILSTGQQIDDFKVGDAPYSAACDYMETCVYKCYPDKNIVESINEESYTEPFIVMNSVKIIQKIGKLFSDKIDGKFFYKKDNLIKKINYPKPYPVVQIYAALTQLIEDANEFIFDKYGRTGHLINIGEYYLFQPSELNNPHIGIFERSTPLDFKNSMAKFELKQGIVNQSYENVHNTIEERKIQPTIVKQGKEVVTQIEEEQSQEREIDRQSKLQQEIEVIRSMKENFEFAMSTARTHKTVPRGDDNWYKHCGVTMKKLINIGIMKTEDALQFLVEHLVDMLSYEEKLELISFIYSNNVFKENTFEYYVKKYLDTKIIRTKRLTSIILFSGEKIQIMIMKNNRWVHAEPEDEREVAIEAVKHLDFSKYSTGKIIGFIGQDQKNKYLVFKVKDMEAKRNTGARCDEASKIKKIQILNELLGDEMFEKYTDGTTKGLVQPELCSLQEFLFRFYNKEKKDNKIWFFDFENAMLSKKELKI